MRDLRISSIAAIAMVVAGVPATAQAGFLDALGEALFGSSAPQASPAPPLSASQNPQSPLRVSIKRSRKGARSIRKSAHHPFPRGRPSQVVRIDPRAEPDWYLRDQTLRRGDVIVLDGRMVVFEGSRESTHTPEEFAGLAQSKAVSDTTRKAIQQSARVTSPATYIAELGSKVEPDAR